MRHTLAAFVIFIATLAFGFFVIRAMFGPTVALILIALPVVYGCAFFVVMRVKSRR